MPTSWSPDSRYIAYTSYRGNTFDIRLLDLLEGTSILFATTAVYESCARFSPDGHWIAYVSDGEVMVAAFPFLPVQASRRKSQKKGAPERAGAGRVANSSIWSQATT